MRMRRVVVLLPPATVKSSDAMAARYGSSRSEVLRHAIAEGMPGVRKPLERLRKARLEGLRAVGDRDAVDVARRRGGRPAGSVAVPGLEGVDVADRASAVERLVEHGRSVRGLDPHLPVDGVRVALLAYAAVLGVSADDVDDVVDDAMEVVFPDDGIVPAPNPNAPPE